jgi:hypothetical protein
MDEPAEQAEIFQFELLKKMDKLIESFEKVNKSLEKLAEKK